MAQVTFNISGTVVSIDDKEYMKGDLHPELVGDGYYFSAGDPLTRVHNWIPYYQAIDGSTGDPFASLEDFTTWVTDNVFVPGEGGAPATVEDGSITEAKLAPALAAKVDGAATQTALTAHVDDTGNPHSVTPGQIGAATIGAVSGVQSNLDTHENKVAVAEGHLPTGGTAGELVTKGAGDAVVWSAAPTAASLGAVSKLGDNMTGALTVLPSGGNGVVFSGSPSGGVPAITTVGANANISLSIAPKGTAGVEIENSLTVNGDLHMSEQKVINIADGSNARDAVNFQQLAAKLTATQGVAVSDATDATDVIVQFNALLASLRAANIIAT